ncbi:MAG: phosphoribosylamine-glycine ligase [Segetibacter sp.]|nr:phosphoribosylamine-glycine ligase [Segetibacter sp.]
MNILLLGSGGREHAFAWKVKQSERCSELFIAPGNAGTASFGKNVAIAVTDFEAIKNFCITEKIEMVIVGPEDPLVLGIYDFFIIDKSLQHIIVIGPSAAGAQLEGSKAFSKRFMQRHNIPTAGYGEFNESNFDDGIKYLEQHSTPIVLKADGLAAGKGVVICENSAEAKEVFTAMIKDRQFGEASAKVVVEEFLQGIEVSVFVLTDGKNYKILGHAKDYKRIGEGDTGPNTGGMGCVSPVSFVDQVFMQKVEKTIIEPTIKGIHEEGLTYKGFVFFGLIKVNDEPYLIEYNCRMGDPETEVVIPKLKNDLVHLFVAMHKGDLQNQLIEIDERACCTVMAVSGGYPGEYRKNMSITGLNKIFGQKEMLIFHAGTKQNDDQIVTNGGRVLAVTCFGDNIKEAVTSSMEVLKNISFEGMYYRKDIGYEFD